MVSDNISMGEVDLQLVPGIFRQKKETAMGLFPKLHCFSVHLICTNYKYFRRKFALFFFS
jgi:hypothetical protein